ncbi:MAG: family 1 encapsulin nanocompartment shell protein [Dehalococcoidales bacterium]|nr:family 1 encapsulin nanocompartment shell protein [Dehalococcoidales bacterium]
MTNKFLTREDAPIETKTWEALDTTMMEAARSVLSGRRILAIEGPYGLGLKAIALSDPETDDSPAVSPVLPLALIHRNFTVAKRDLAAFERDGILLDTKQVAEAALACAAAEDALVFKGTREVRGLLNARGSNSIKLSDWEQVGTAAGDVINAVTTLDNAGFHGPYVLALTPERYNLLLRYYPSGNLSELEHIKKITAEGVIKAPALESGGVLLAAGRQFASIIVGQDMAVGFIGPAGESLEFSVSESLSPYIRVPQAVCILEG